MINKARTSLARAVAIFLLAISPAHAAESLAVAGLAVYRDTARDIYVAGLLRPAGASTSLAQLRAGPTGMEYRVAIRRISSRGFFGTLLLQADLGSGRRAPEPATDAVARLKSLIDGALLEGDHFRISLLEDGRTEFSLNGTTLLTLADPAVFGFFLDGWVGESASELFRNALLAQQPDGELLERFDNLAPGTGRSAQVAAWMAPKPVLETVAVPEIERLAMPAPRVKTPPVAASVPESATPPVVYTASAVTPRAAVIPAPQESPASPSQETTPAREEVKPPVAERVSSTLDDRSYQRQLREYITRVMKQVYGEVEYPRQAIRRTLEGKVDVLAKVDGGGDLIDLTLDSSSGHGVLDKAAEKAVRKAAPFPELNDVAREEFATDDGNYLVSVPITFRLSR